jgi:hypothetical protein
MSICLQISLDKLFILARMGLLNKVPVNELSNCLIGVPPRLGYGEVI